MAKSLRKNRFSIAGLVLPLFCLLILGGLGLGVFPGWIKPAQGVPGTQCSSSSCDSGDPLAGNCDACNNEFCAFNSGAQQFQCAVGSPNNPDFNPAATPTPACPNFAEAPGCWTSCTNQHSDSNPFENCNNPICAPNDSFCDGISGGTAANECRNGVCTTNGNFDSTNPSGCDYTLTPTANAAQCRDCQAQGLATLQNCGDGICEPGEGESCTTCAVDCLLPGFEDACPLTTGTVIGDACTAIIAPPPAAITFDGPQYNVPNQGQCEDGDLCTDNSCGVGAVPICNATPKSCQPDGDFCCPAGCAAPAPGGTCRDVTGAPIAGCDPDCYVPVDCIPTPSPIPPVAKCLEGSGGFGGSKSGPGCNGFACSFHPGATDSSSGQALLGLGMLGLGALFLGRKLRA